MGDRAVPNPPPETRTWNADRFGYDVEGPCWECQQPIRYFVDEDGTPRDIMPAAPPPLDVERLARVLAEHFGPSYFPGLTDVTIHGPSPQAVAEQIAAEYARLGSQEGSAE